MDRPARRDGQVLDASTAAHDRGLRRGNPRHAPSDRRWPLPRTKPAAASRGGFPRQSAAEISRLFQTRPAAQPGARTWDGRREVTYVDLSIAQVIAGLRYAFPIASHKALRSCPQAARVARRVRPSDRATSRRDGLAFNDDDLFRRYRRSMDDRRDRAATRRGDFAVSLPRPAPCTSSPAEVDVGTHDSPWR